MKLSPNFSRSEFRCKGCTPGSFFGGAVPYYKMDNVRLMRPADVQAWLAANSLPGHEWAGGNNG